VKITYYLLNSVLIEFAPLATIRIFHVDPQVETSAQLPLSTTVRNAMLTLWNIYLLSPWLLSVCACGETESPVLAVSDVNDW